jgi:hypothetical protein
MEKVPQYFPKLIARLKGKEKQTTNRTYSGSNASNLFITATKTNI